MSSQFPGLTMVLGRTGRLKFEAPPTPRARALGWHGADSTQALEGATLRLILGSSRSRPQMTYDDLVTIRLLQITSFCPDS